MSAIALLALVGILVVERSRQTEHKLRKQTEEALLSAERAQAAESRARSAEVEQRKRAEQAVKELRTARYGQNITLAERELGYRNVDVAEQLLDDCPGDFRHWEWYFLKRLCHSEQRTLTVETGNVASATFSRNGKGITSITTDGTLIESDAATGALKSTRQISTNQVDFAAFNRNRSFVATTEFRNSFVTIWDVAEDRPICSGQPTDARGADNVAISSNGELIALSTTNDAIRIWNVAGREVIRTIPLPYQRVTGLVFSANDRRVAWDTGRMSEYDKDGKEIAEQPGRVWIAAVRSGSEPIALGTVDAPVLAISLKGHQRAQRGPCLQCRRQTSDFRQISFFLCRRVN